MNILLATSYAGLGLSLLMLAGCSLAGGVVALAMMERWKIIGCVIAGIGAIASGLLLFVTLPLFKNYNICALAFAIIAISNLAILVYGVYKKK